MLSTTTLTDNSIDVVDIASDIADVSGNIFGIASNSVEYKLKPLDFSKYENHFMKPNFLMTKKNPFKTMSDIEWAEYVHSREPHFTTEPHYEMICWEKLRCLESDTTEAGWELVLRTTNNTAYCPAHVDQKWCQRTQWIFAYPGLQFIIIITYNEDRYSLIKDVLEPKLSNYFGLEIISTTAIKTRPIEYDNSDDDNYIYDLDDYDNSNYRYRARKYETKYIEMINAPNGWIRNGGMTDENGTCNFKYMFQKDVNEDKKDCCLLETQFPKSFWKDLIENNKAEIIPGKFANVQITHWDDISVFPGDVFINIKNVLQWEMSFLFIQKFMKSNIHKWITKVYGFECADNINTNFWENDISWEKSHTPEFKKISSVIEGKHKHCNEWAPLDKYSYDITLFMFEEIRLSANAVILIDQMWEYIKSKN
jgi:hypothetical protein